MVRKLSFFSALLTISLLAGCNDGKSTTTTSNMTEPKSKITLNVGDCTKKIRSLGIKYMVANQNSNGSYGKNGKRQVGKTALVVWSMATSQRGYQYLDGPYMSMAVDFIVNRQNNDGSFGKDKASAKFNTSASILALKGLTNNKRFAKQIRSGELWLAKNGCQKNDSLLDWGWPKNKSKLASLYLEADKNIKAKKGGEWINATLMEIITIQDTKDDLSITYGRCVNSTASDIEADPIIATALSVKIADMIKDNYKRLK